MNLLKKKNGFTIIEVVLVLAIAGLIFLMVFVALPALQRNERDTARKRDMGSVLSDITTYMSNNRGEFPDTAGFAGYAQELSENITEVEINDTTGAQVISPEEGVIVVTESTTCGTSTAEEQELLEGSARQYTVVTKIEAGSGVYYCQDN